MERSGAFWSVLERSGAFWSVLECSGGGRGAGPAAKGHGAAEELEQHARERPHVRRLRTLAISVGRRMEGPRFVARASGKRHGRCLCSGEGTVNFSLKVARVQKGWWTWQAPAFSSTSGETYLRAELAQLHGQTQGQRSNAAVVKRHSGQTYSAVPQKEVVRRGGPSPSLICGERFFFTATWRLFSTRVQFRT